MPKQPRKPPSASFLRELGPEIFVLEPDERPAARIYPTAGAYPCEWNAFRWFGPVNSRFDHHPPPTEHHDDRGILYGAFSLTTCLAEYFQDGRTIHRRAAPHFVVFDITRPLELLDLRGAWPTRAGGSMKLNSGRRDVSRAWSRRFYEAFPDIDGLIYPSSMHANEPAVALYERARDALPEAPVVDRPLDAPLFLGDIKRAARTIGYDIVPTF